MPSVRVLEVKFPHGKTEVINVSSAVLPALKVETYWYFFFCLLYCDLVERAWAIEQSTDMALFVIWPARFPFLSFKFYTYITRR